MEIGKFDVFLLLLIVALLIIGTTSKIVHYKSYNWLKKHGYIRAVRKPNVKGLYNEVHKI